MVETTRVIFSVILGEPKDPPTLRVVPPLWRFPQGTTRFTFHNTTKHTVVVVVPAHSATPRELVLQQGQTGYVDVSDAKSGDVSYCTTDILWSSCPLCATDFAESRKTLRLREERVGEPIIIID